jgi:hypothetical protein
MKYQKPKNEFIRQKFNRECEDIITKEIPELTGKFASENIWNDLYFLFLSGVSSKEAAEKIINRYKKQ